MTNNDNNQDTTETESSADEMPRDFYIYVTASGDSWLAPTRPAITEISEHETRAEAVRDTLEQIEELEQRERERDRDVETDGGLEPGELDELGYIESDPSVRKSTRIADGVAIMWAENDGGPAPNACEVAADHGVDVSVIDRRGRFTCYRVDTSKP